MAIDLIKFNLIQSAAATTGNPYLTTVQGNLFQSGHPYGTPYPILFQPGSLMTQDQLSAYGLIATPMMAPAHANRQH